MDVNNRRSERRAVVLEIELTYPSGETQIVHTRDISEGGLFLIVEKLKQPTIGECVGVKLSGESIGEEVLPSADAVVVHQAQAGIGLAFIEMELDESLFQP